MQLDIHKKISTTLILAILLAAPFAAQAEKKKKPTPQPQSTKVLKNSPTSDESVAASSPSTQKQKWEQEPASFLNIALDKPLIASASEAQDLVWTCKSYKNGSMVYEKTPTIEGTGYHLCGFDIDFFNYYSVVAYTDDQNPSGNVWRIDAPFSSSSFSDVEDLLTQKYGPPHLRQVLTVQNGYGTEFENPIITWMGDNVMITVNKISSKVTMGKIRVTTKSYRDLKETQRKQETEKNLNQF